MRVKIEIFYSPICLHCPPAIDLLREVCAKYGNIEIEEVNVWDERGAAKAIEYKISLVPAIVINGKVTFLGLPDREKLIEAIETALKGVKKP